MPASAITIPANDSSTVTIRFNPDSTGFFNNTLSWSGSIFGSGTLDLEGEGVLPIIDIDTDTIDFGIMPLGTSSISTINISNNGSGSLVVDSLSSAGVTEITFDDQSSSGTTFPFSINNGAGTVSVDVEFSSISAGSFGELIYIYSNDPYNPITSVFVTATCVSQISGNLCNMVLDKSNNPYDVIGDLFVPDSCFLEIGPGVELNMNGYKLVVDGHLNSNAMHSDEIIISNLSLEYNNQVDTLKIKHWNVTGDSANSSSLTAPNEVYFNDMSSNSHWSWKAPNRNEDPLSGLKYTSSMYNSNNAYTTPQSTSSYSYGNYSIKIENYPYNDLFMENTNHPVNITESGYYQISAFMGTAYIHHCESPKTNYIRMHAFYSVNNNEWNHYYTSANNVYYSANDYFDKMTSSPIYLEQGDELRMIYYIDISASNYMYGSYHVSDVKVEQISSSDKLVVWSEDFESNLDQWDNRYTSYTWEFLNQSGEVFDGNNSLQIRGYYAQTSRYNNYIQTKEITIPEDGNYYVEYWQKVTKSDYGSYPRHYWDYGMGTQNSNYYLYHPEWACRSSYEGPLNDWRKVSSPIGFHSSGTKINLQFGYDVYSSSGSYDEVTLYIDNVSLRNADLLNSNPTSIFSNNSIDIDSSIFVNIDVNMLSDSSSVNISSSSILSTHLNGLIKTNEAYSPVQISNSNVENIHTAVIFRCSSK